MLLKMQAARRKEIHACRVEAMSEENEKLQKNHEGLEMDVKSLKDEVERLKLMMTNAKSHL